MTAPRRCTPGQKLRLLGLEGRRLLRACTPAAPGCAAKAGELGCIALTRWVESEKRYRVSVGYVGEGLKADTFYELNDDGEFVEVE